MGIKKGIYFFINLVRIKNVYTFGIIKTIFKYNGIY
jgi:hypothetical protein